MRAPSSQLPVRSPRKMSGRDCERLEGDWRRRAGRALSGAGSASASRSRSKYRSRKRWKVRAAEIDAGARGGFFENPLVGPPGHLDAVERARDPEQIFERPVHRAASGATRSNERAVDVEQNDRSLRTDVAGAGALGRRLFVERDALSFGELNRSCPARRCDGRTIPARRHRG